MESVEAQVNGIVGPTAPEATVIGTTYDVLLSYSVVTTPAYHCVPLSKKVADMTIAAPECAATGRENFQCPEPNVVEDPASKCICKKTVLPMAL